MHLELTDAFQAMKTWNKLRNTQSPYLRAYSMYKEAIETKKNKPSRQQELNPWPSRYIAPGIKLESPMAY